MPCTIIFQPKNQGQSVNFKSKVLASYVVASNNLFYHLTDKPKFKLNPKYEPEDNSISIQDRSGRPGIYIAPDIEKWVNGHNYWRPFVVEFEVDPSVKDDEGVHGRWSGEMFIPAASFSKIKIKRVIPLDAYAREKFHAYGWIETELKKEFDSGNEITNPRQTFPNYKYSGPDVRDMPTSETTRLKKDLKKVKG